MITFGRISQLLRKKAKSSRQKPADQQASRKPAYQITPEIQDILDAVASADGRVIFVTGAAGTGKSTLIDILRAESGKSIVVVAPTGIAAINSGGQTIHSMFHLAPGPQPVPQTIRGIKGLVLKNMDVLIIDEVSMVRADLMDAVAASLRLNLRNHQSPFAGKTIVLIGDMHQLPPIVATHKERQLFQERYDTPYFFSAESLQSIEPITKQLTESFRQKDQEFVDILNRIRVGMGLKDSIETLNQHCFRPGTDTNSGLTLTTINAKADSINQSKLNEIDRPVHVFEAELEGKWGERENQLPAPRTLELKVGAQVMFLKNHASWVNGTIGKILEISDQSARVRIESGPFEGEVTVHRETWERVKYSWNAGQRRIDTVTVGTYTQLPFRLAWAVTIHKAQGLTLDRVTIDLDRGTFERGQAYVALSRCRTMNGITLSRPLRVDDIKLDESIAEFYSQICG